MDINLINILIKHAVNLSSLNTKSNYTNIINELELLGMDKNKLLDFTLHNIYDSGLCNVNRL